MKNKLYSTEWEAINCNTQRMKVPGGWLVQVFTNLELSLKGLSISLSFVPDKERCWKVVPNHPYKVNS